MGTLGGWSVRRRSAVAALAVMAAIVLAAGAETGGASGQSAAEALPTVSIDDTSATEGNAGTTDLVFTVSLSAASAQQVDIVWSTQNGTAIAPADYEAAGSTVSLAPGQATASIAVKVYGDAVPEPDESLQVNLTSATNATILDGVALGTIVNDDSLPTLGVGDVTVAEGGGRRARPGHSERSCRPRRRDRQCNDGGRDGDRSGRLHRHEHRGHDRRRPEDGGRPRSDHERRLRRADRELLRAADEPGQRDDLGRHCRCDRRRRRPHVNVDRRLTDRDRARRRSRASRRDLCGLAPPGEREDCHRPVPHRGRRGHRRQRLHRHVGNGDVPAGRDVEDCRGSRDR